ncbi:MFS transporter [Umezawaea beigongshangensis]|uniref:MFS transporter n=1 Tax=Umezawaea beigongshangensis TaxID=2780383 RepID=UPI0018F202F3|nr:MFS transporter [Umezawaea beigongshangensis]
MSVAAPPADPTTTPTPVGRLSAALLASQTGLYIALLTPLQLLLALQLTRISGGTAATSAFSLVTGVGAIVALVFTPIAGRISDLTTFRLGRRRTGILVGSVTGAVVLVLLGSATTVWQVVLLWCVAKAALSFQHASTTATVADQVPPHRRGIVSGTLGLGIALSPLLGIALVNALPAGSATQWYAIAGTTVVGGGLAVLLIREGRPVRRERPALGLGGVLRTFWLDPRRHPAFGWAWLVRFLITAAYASGTYLAFFLIQRFGAGPAEVGGLVFAMTVVNTVCLVTASLAAGHFSDRLARQKPFVVAAGLLAAASMCTMAFAPSILAVFVIHGVVGIGIGVFLSVDLAMCVRVLPHDEDAAKDLAIVNIANTLPQSLVPLVAPLLLGIGGFTALFGFLGLLGVVGAIAVRRVPEIGQEGGAPGVAPLTRLPAEPSS